MRLTCASSMVESFARALWRACTRGLQLLLRTALLVEPRQLDKQRKKPLPKLSTAALRPLLVAAFWQELPEYSSMAAR